MPPPSQTTTNFPLESIATRGFTWSPVVEVLTRNSGPTGCADAGAARKVQKRIAPRKQSEGQVLRKRPPPGCSRRACARYLLTRGKSTKRLKESASCLGTGRSRRYWQSVCVVVAEGGGVTDGAIASAVTVTTTSFEIMNEPHEGN